MKMHARLSTWLQLGLAVVAYGVVSTARGQACETLVVQCEACTAGEKLQVWNSVGAVVQTSIWEGGESQTLDVRSLPPGLHMLQVGASTTPFIVK